MYQKPKVERLGTLHELSRKGAEQHSERRDAALTARLLRDPGEDPDGPRHTVQNRSG